MPAVAQAEPPESVNLLADATVREKGTYTYYAKGNTAATESNPTGGIAPWTVAFFPGSGYGSMADRDAGASAVWNQSFTASNAGAISIGSGELARSGSDNSVLGWQGITQYVVASGGNFDILFDLGASYHITSIEIVYSDSVQRRWITSSALQTAYVSEVMPVAASYTDMTQFGDRVRATANASEGVMTFSEDEGLTGRYVNLNLFVSASRTFDDVNRGGIIHEVRIHGYAIPEPGTYALIGAGVMLAFVLVRKRRG